ncbi:hypothetical protein LINPERHAP1_LOCUS33050 [Linum perenne]
MRDSMNKENPNCCLEEKDASRSCNASTTMLILFICLILRVLVPPLMLMT